MKALVTGGAGFLGSHLVRRLSSEGATVTVLDDFSSASPSASDLPAEVVRGSVVEPPPLPGPFDLIAHLASPASPPRYLRDPVGTLRTGAEGTRQILDLAATWGSHVLYTSTSEVYGDPEVHPQPESYPGAVEVSSERACYDEGKRYAEALIHAYRRTGALAAPSIVRLFNTYGPGMDPDDGRVVTSFLTSALAGRPLTVFGDGSQTRSFCFVEDLIDGLMAVIELRIEGPLNLGNDEEITMLELADAVEELLGATGREYHPLPDADPKRRRPDLTLARRLFGWNPRTPLSEGLAATADYLRSLP
ncbi:MAG: NAD-dependent epimerase/dehydratase family protein [Acidimicrobiia bacterium]|nr:NAD-dependent epimerase/dehydratase family protein [Acidimicrobiia bacterium]